MSGPTLLDVLAAELAALDPERIDREADRFAPILAGLRDRRPTYDGWLRGAEKIAAYIDSPRSRVYALVSAGRIPVHKDGSALLASKRELDTWIRAGGARRP
jgi:excisionase family DNA binding protein